MTNKDVAQAVALAAGFFSGRGEHQLAAQILGKYRAYAEQLDLFELDDLDEMMELAEETRGEDFPDEA